MKLPHDVAFHDDIRLLVWRPRGLLNKMAVNKILTILDQLELSSKEPFNRFSDTVAADAVDLNFRYVIHVSLYRRSVYANRSPVKSAILATDATMIHYARIHALLTQGSPINARVFSDRGEAAQWLDVPVERLGIETSADQA
jgi:hypothetical protein